LQVNRTSLRGLDCLLAVPALAAAGDAVELLLSRDGGREAASRPDSIEEEDEDGLGDEGRLRTPEQTRV